MYYYSCRALLLAALLVAAAATGACTAPNPLYARAGRGGPDLAADGGLPAGDAPLADTAPGALPFTDATAAPPPGDGAMGSPTAPADARDGGAAPTDARAPAVDGGSDTAAPAAFKGDLAKALTLYLPLDDGAGKSVARDASGKKSIASLKSIDAVAGWATGRFGSALAVTGSATGASWSGWVEVAGDALVDAASPGFTISLWIRRTGGDGALVSRRSLGARGYLFRLAVENGSLGLELNATAAYALHLVGNGTVPTGRWVHVAATFDVKVARIYVDGNAAAASPYQQAIPLDTTPFIIGGAEQQNQSVTGRFPGLVDDVAFYSRALTSDEIAALAAGAQPPAR